MLDVAGGLARLDLVLITREELINEMEIVGTFDGCGHAVLFVCLLYSQSVLSSLYGKAEGSMICTLGFSKLR